MIAWSDRIVSRKMRSVWGHLITLWSFTDTGHDHWPDQRIKNRSVPGMEKRKINAGIWEKAEPVSERSFLKRRNGSSMRIAFRITYQRISVFKDAIVMSCKMIWRCWIHHKDPLSWTIAKKYQWRQAEGEITAICDWSCTIWWEWIQLMIHTYTIHNERETDNLERV